MIDRFGQLQKRWAFWGLALGVCLIGYWTPKPTRTARDGDDAFTSNSLAPIDLSRPTDQQPAPPAVRISQAHSHTVIHGLNVEAGIRDRYGVLFNEIPEAGLYFEFLAKSGIPEQFHWRAFRVLHDFALRLGEHDHDVAILKSRLTEMESASGGKTDPATVSELESAKLEMKSAIERRSWFQARGYEALRKYHPQLSDETLETLFRFRPKEIPFALPHVERDDVFLGTEP